MCSEKWEIWGLVIYPIVVNTLSWGLTRSFWALLYYHSSDYIATISFAPIMIMRHSSKWTRTTTTTRCNSLEASSPADVVGESAADAKILVEVRSGYGFGVGVGGEVGSSQGSWWIMSRRLRGERLVSGRIPSSTAARIALSTSSYVSSPPPPPHCPPTLITAALR